MHLNDEKLLAEPGVRVALAAKHSPHFSRHFILKA
jgi:hypothetical protein